jgi:transposase
MPQKFIGCDRDQAMLMPLSLLDWVPEDHFVWTLLGAVDRMDLGSFYGAYRADGHGRPAYEPKMMVALTLYAYARGNRSSRWIERACVEDVVYRVVTANQAPDHSTIAEFRKRHENALAGLFTDVLALCAEAGLVNVGVIAVDGTKVAASASNHATRDYEQIAKEILAEADRIDREEDELYGDARGDELPEQLRTREGRRDALAEAKRRLERDRQAEQPEAKVSEMVPAGLRLQFDAEVIVARGQGREGWLREASHQLDEYRRSQAIPVARSRIERLLEAERRLREDLAVECAANEAYEAYRAGGLDKRGRRFGGPPKPYLSPIVPAGTINLTDPDSRNLKAFRGYIQGYNAQAVVTARQIVIAAEVNSESGDFGHLEPMINAARKELAAAGITDQPGVALGDAGYWNFQQMDKLAADGIQVLIPPDASNRKDPRPGWHGGRYSWMRHLLATELGGQLYRKRQGMIEPVFADLKFNRKINRFQRRGDTAARSEWRLATATHNLLKLHNHRNEPGRL